MKLSSKRSMNLAVGLSDAEAERLLMLNKKQRDTQILNSSAASDQLVLVAELKPRRFRSKWQRLSTKDQQLDSETAEGSRWVAFLADLLRHTDTPMGRLMRENPSNIQLLGWGLRAGTLRSRVRSIRKFLEWLSAAHNVAFPVHRHQLIEFLQVRLSEPCVRGSLKAAHRSFLFLQEAAGISEKITDSALYDVARKELFAAALPGRAPRQAPRFPSILLGAFEDNVMDSSLPFFGVCCRGGSCFRHGLRCASMIIGALFLRTWRFLRQDWSANYLGPRATGQDKRVAFRVLVIHPSAFVHQKDWLATGWALLVKEAPYARDYLLPAPANNHGGFKRKELTYHTAFAVQSQIVFAGFVSRFTDFQNTYKPLLHAPQRSQFYANSNSSSRVQQV